jgi:hypothetical protein
MGGASSKISRFGSRKRERVATLELSDRAAPTKGGYYYKKRKTLATQIQQHPSYAAQDPIIEEQSAQPTGVYLSPRYIKKLNPINQKNLRGANMGKF